MVLEKDNEGNVVICRNTLDKVLQAWENCPNGNCKTHEDKAFIIRLYNEIYKENYRTTTNCSACLNAVYKGIKHVVEYTQNYYGKGTYPTYKKRNT